MLIEDCSNYQPINKEELDVFISQQLPSYPFTNALAQVYLECIDPERLFVDKTYKDNCEAINLTAYPHPNFFSLKLLNEFKKESCLPQIDFTACVGSLARRLLDRNTDPAAFSVMSIYYGRYTAEASFVPLDRVMYLRAVDSQGINDEQSGILYGGLVGNGTKFYFPDPLGGNRFLCKLLEIADKHTLPLQDKIQIDYSLVKYH